jgi:MYXO-CTERM domain-containing protein
MGWKFDAANNAYWDDSDEPIKLSSDSGDPVNKPLDKSWLWLLLAVVVIAASRRR